MMHKNGYVVAIKCGGKVLREDKGDVFLKLDSEYSILIKNTRHKRCGVRVEIDGTSVLGEESLIVGAMSEVELERFVIDGDLNKGKKFKFVSPNHEDVQDHTSKDIGKVKITFVEEKDQIPPSGYNFIHDCWIPQQATTPTYGTNGVDYAFPLGNSGQVWCAQEVTTSNLGATVGGSYSKQSFQRVEFEASKTFTTIELRLNIYKDTVTVKDVIYCTSCGAKHKFTDNFCSKCGTELK